MTESSHGVGEASAFTNVLAVLGMHRSGTSCLAGTLQCMGLQGGRVRQWNFDNMRGQRENVAVMLLNERLLAENSARWDSPPECLTWNDCMIEARDALLAGNLQSDRPWMFKDPRTLLTLPFWKQAIPNLRMTGTFHHPLRVAASLYFRDKMPIADGLQLWCVYNEHLLREYDRAEFPIVCFDVPQESYLSAVTAAVSKLCADWIAHGDLSLDLGAQFYDQSLMHQRQREVEEWSGVAAGLGDVSHRARELYRQLRLVAGAIDAELKASTPAAETGSFMVAALSAADLLAANSCVDEAMEQFRSLLPMSSDRPAIWRRLIALYQERQRTEEALAVYREATADSPDDATLWLEMSKLQWGRGDLDAALMACRRATEAAPAWPDAWIQHGHWLSHQQRWFEAAACFERAIEIEGENESLRVLLDECQLHTARGAASCALLMP